MKTYASWTENGVLASEQPLEYDDWSEATRTSFVQETVATVFNKKNRLNLPNLRLRNADIAYVTSYRYLGVNLHHKLDWRM